MRRSNRPSSLYHARRPNRARRGVAFLLVLIAVAGAAVMAWAMISTSSLRAQIGVNATDGVEADALAESGANLAIYYLRYPSQAPVATIVGASGNSHYPGESDLTLWPGARGTVTLSVTNPKPDQFRIVSVARVPSNDGSGFASRTVIATATLSYSAYKVERATYANGNIVVPSNVTVTGDLASAGTVTVQPGATVTGAIYAANGSAFANGQNAAIESPVPAYADLQAIKDTATRPPNATASERAYTYNGQQYLAQMLNITVTGTLGPTPSNPLGIFFADRDTTIRNATINGTVVVRSNRKLTARGSVTITPANGMPALVTGTLDVQSTNASPATVIASGVVWLGASIVNTASTSSAGSLTINGALLMNSPSGAIDASARMPIAINFNAANARVPTLAGGGGVTGVSVTSWSTR